MERKRTARRRRLPKRNALSIITALALISSTFVVATALPASAACDYQDAGANDGWGWDPETRTSCAPQTTPPPAVASNCDYSAAGVNNGWGWDPVARQSCPPLESTPGPAVTTPAPTPEVSYQITEPVSQEVADILVLAERTSDSGRQAIVSRTDNDGFRIVDIDAQGRTSVVQVEPGSTVWNLTDWHFEGRSELNTGLPESIDDAIRDNGWRRLSPSQSVFHQDPSVVGNEVKFVHEDGREAVYYVDGTLVTKPEFAGTFNYVNARPEPEGLLDIQGIIEWAWFGAGHLIADVVPFVIARDAGGGNGNSRGDNPGPLGTTSAPDETNLDLRDDDDDGIPAGQDLDDKDPNRGARPGTTFADDDGDGIINFNDEFPNDPTQVTSNPCAGSMSAAASCGGGGSDSNGGGDGGGGGLQDSNGNGVQTSTGGTVQTNG